MSTYAYVKLYLLNEDNTELRAYKDVNVDYMKECLLCNDWVDALEDLAFDFPSKLDPPDVEVIGYVSPELAAKMAEQLKTQKESSFGRVISVDEDSILVDGYYPLYGEQQNKQLLCLSEAKKNGVPESWKKVKRECSIYNRRWVSIKTLSEAFDKKAKELDDVSKKVEKLEAIKFSPEYYKLDDDGKAQLLSDLDIESESKETILSQMSAFARLQGLLDGFYEMNYKQWEDTVVGLLYIC